MSPRNTRRVMMFLVLILWAASGYALYWGWNPTPLRISAPTVEADSAAAEPGASVPAAAPPERVSKETLAANWDRPLRRALYDPPPPPKPEPPPKKPPPPIRAILLATMIEADSQTAMLQLEGGKVVFRKAGDRLIADDDTTVISEIKPGMVTVVRGDDITEFTVDGQRNR